MPAAGSERSSSARPKCGWRREPGKRAHVDETPDVKLLQEPGELLQRPVAVADRIDHERTATSMPTASPSSAAALAWLAAISTSPMLFSYQNGAPRGAAEKTRACADAAPDDRDRARGIERRRAQSRHRVAVVVDVDDAGEVARAELDVEPRLRSRRRRELDAPRAMRAAAGANRSRPWNETDSGSAIQSRGMTRTPRDRAASTDRSPLSGPTNQRPSASSAMAARSLPTPGSTTAIVTAPGGRRGASAASRCAFCLDVEARRVVEEIDHRASRRLRVQHGLDLPDVDIGGAEIGEQEDRRAHAAAVRPCRRLAGAVDVGDVAVVISSSRSQHDLLAEHVARARPLGEQRRASARASAGTDTGA